MDSTEAAKDESKDEEMQEAPENQVCAHPHPHPLQKNTRQHPLTLHLFETPIYLKTTGAHLERISFTFALISNLHSRSFLHDSSNFKSPNFQKLQNSRNYYFDKSENRIS